MNVYPGQRIGRKFVLVRPIGQGGMATVWVAEDRERRRRVAIKVLSAALTDKPRIVERFMSEARTMERLQSPFVPQVHEFGRLSDGTPYMAMELCDGSDLDVYLRTRGRLSLTSTARLLSQIAGALTEAHGMGIVHRDVKAENILIMSEGDRLHAKLVDFGIAKNALGAVAQNWTQTATLGTPAYMSPEQLTSTKDVDARADVWSLGVVAYLALTGKTPFDGDTFIAVCLSIRTGVFDLPSHLLPELPAEVDAWISKALHPDPGRRFQTARELSDALAVIAKESTTLHPPTTEAYARDDRTTVDGVSRARRTTRVPPRRFGAAWVAVCAAAAAMLVAFPRLHLATRPVAAATPPVAAVHTEVHADPPREIAAPPASEAAPEAGTLFPTTVASAIVPAPPPPIPPRVFRARPAVVVHLEPPLPPAPAPSATLARESDPAAMTAAIPADAGVVLEADAGAPRRESILAAGMVDASSESSPRAEPETRDGGSGLEGDPK
jgi:hypothetical protein